MTLCELTDFYFTFRLAYKDIVALLVQRHRYVVSECDLKQVLKFLV